MLFERLLNILLQLALNFSELDIELLLHLLFHLIYGLLRLGLQNLLKLVHTSLELVELRLLLLLRYEVVMHRLGEELVHFWKRLWR